MTNLPSLAIARTDTPSADLYYAGEISRVTSFSVNQTVRLEILGVHPPSSCDSHVWGVGWPKASVDDFVRFLRAEPEYRAWLLSLLGDTPINVPVSARQVEVV